MIGNEDTDDERDNVNNVDISPENNLRENEDLGSGEQCEVVENVQMYKFRLTSLKDLWEEGKKESV